MTKPRRFPCPYCKGEGSWIEPVLDYGEGPYYECGVCKGEGTIIIDGPIHQELKEWKISDNRRRERLKKVFEGRKAQLEIAKKSPAGREHAIAYSNAVTKYTRARTKWRNFRGWE